MPASSVAIVGAALLLSASATTLPGKMRCDFYKQVGCTAAKCFDATEKSWSIIDWDQKVYALCDVNECQRFPFHLFSDGIYLSLDFPDRDLMFKLNTTDNSAVETSTFMNTAIVSFGNCAKDENK